MKKLFLPSSSLISNSQGENGMFREPLVSLLRHPSSLWKNKHKRKSSLLFCFCFFGFFFFHLFFNERIKCQQLQESSSCRIKFITDVPSAVLWVTVGKKEVVSISYMVALVWAREGTHACTRVYLVSRIGSGTRLAFLSLKKMGGLMKIKEQCPDVSWTFSLFSPNIISNDL